ncbi:MAG: 6-phosphofructokinase [Planctomycetota bacterium]|jgi:6-phosphofructokinase 1
MGDVIKGNAVIGQSGGPTAVINQSLVGVIETLKKHSSVPRILGAQHGVRGIVEEKFISLKGIRDKELERVAVTPAAALGSTRDKPDAEYCRRIFKVFAKNDVRYFFYIGGNDSADTARIVNELATREHYELRVFHIPKTIDNDLRVTDHTPGYGSAARFVASAFMGEDRDNNSLPGIKISVVMGRHAGWLTAASSLGRSDPSDGPHLIYVPEVPFDTARFLEDVKEVYDKFGRCLIAASEGIADETGTPVAVALAEKLGHRVERDSHGNVQLSGSGALGDFLADFIRSEMKQRYKALRVRADTYGYLQRSFAGYASPVDQAEAREAGQRAVEYAMAGDLDGSVVFKRQAGKTYKIKCARAELSDVAKETRHLPNKYINRAGNNITNSFKDYAGPLTGGLPAVGKLSK